MRCSLVSLEIALDVQRVCIEQRHHALSGRQIGPGSQLHVGDDAGDGSAHFAALEVELGKRKVRDGLVVGGLRRALRGDDLVHPLLGDDDTRRQRAVALQIARQPRRAWRALPSSTASACFSAISYRARSIRNRTSPRWTCWLS